MPIDRSQKSNSGFIPSKNIEKRLVEMTAILDQTFEKIPLYFVNIDTMNKLTPKNLIFIERNFTSEIMKKNIKTGMKNLLNLMKEFLHSKEVYGYGSDVIGYFTPDGDNISHGPHLIICPEKITSRREDMFEDIIIEVILHELCHAYFYEGKKDRNNGIEFLTESLNSFYKELVDEPKEPKGNDVPTEHIIEHIIEESLCEDYAFSRFDNVSKIIEFMTDRNRPPEYTSFPFWLKHNPENLSVLMQDWRMRNTMRFLLMGISPWVNMLGDDPVTRTNTFEDLASLILMFQ